MPELPEVETVRRGLQPVMRDRRSSSRKPGAKTCGFRSRRILSRGLRGQTVTGLGRRAKYLLADLASGDVLLMHLGMSGLVPRHRRARIKQRRAEFHRPRSEDRAPRPCRISCHRARPVVFNDPRRFGYMKIIARHALEGELLLSGLGPEPLGNEFDAAMLARACAKQEDQPEGGAARSARGRGTRQHLCSRGAVIVSHLSPRRLAATLATKPAPRKSSAAGQRKSVAGANRPITPNAWSVQSTRC